jgi:hypothetical protein
VDLPPAGGPSRLRRWLALHYGARLLILLTSLLVLALLFLFFTYGWPAQSDGTRATFAVAVEYDGAPPGQRSLPESGGLKAEIYQRPKGWVVRVGALLGWSGERGGPLNIYFIAPKGATLLGSQPLGARKTLANPASEIYVLTADLTEAVTSGFNKASRKSAVTMDFAVPDSTIYAPTRFGEGRVVADFLSPDSLNPIQTGLSEIPDDLWETNELSSMDCEGRMTVSLSTSGSRITSVALLNPLVQVESTDTRVVVEGEEETGCPTVSFRAAVVSEGRQAIAQATLYVAAILGGILLSFLAPPRRTTSDGSG